ncbi:hypothetical protein [Planctobacterium marinum]|uniref:Uncharacterized protein n=1 Tax=Planctobacterium marinum TaxID=1631968 RepID=A0AA48HTA9_9ALTE|nr:hypothetical protein MACH26_09640 [Planctobacterium marinum]
MSVSQPKLPPNVRVMIGLCASPTLMVIGFLLYNLATAQWTEIGISTLIFSALGFFAYSIVITGRVPFLTKSSN